MTKLHTIIFSALLGAIPAHGASPVLGIDGEEHSSIGIYIKDLNADSVLFESDAERALIPASIMKAFTSASALSILGPEYRFTTQVNLVGTLNQADSLFTGNIQIIPSGDPTLESAHFKSTAGFCDSVAKKLTRVGIAHIKGEVIITDDMPGDGPVPQWEIDDVAWAYGAGIHRLNYRDNIFQLNPATGQTRPTVPSLDITVMKSASGNNLVRGMWSDHLFVFGATPTNKKWVVTSTMPSPAAVLKYELTQHLADAGIEVSEPDAKLAANAQVTPLYTHNSVRLRYILRSLMVRSDNMFAEGVLRAFAPGSTRDRAISKELALWKDRGLSTQYITVKDGSGLARVDRLSPRFLGEVLEYMADSEYAALYTSLFPRAGKEGTVKSFMAKTPLSGRLVLKSGSMNGVQCYAGYLLDSNDTPSHVVVFIANSFFCDRATLRTALQNLLLDKLTE